MFYKGRYQECIDYDNQVTAAKNYKGVTKNWANPIEINGEWYILKHQDYNSKMQLVSELPKKEEQI